MKTLKTVKLDSLYENRKTGEVVKTVGWMGLSVVVNTYRDYNGIFVRHTRSLRKISLNMFAEAYRRVRSS